MNAPINHIDVFSAVLHKYCINQEDVCLLSSCSLAVRGIKKNNDIEFAVKPSIRKNLLEKYKSELQMNPYSGAIKFEPRIENDLNLYSTMGVYDDNLFKESFSELWNGYRIIIPEIYTAQLILQNREKDETYIHLIHESILWSDDFNNRVEKLLDIARKNGLQSSFKNRDDVWYQLFKYSRKIYIFGTGHIGEHVFYRVLRDGFASKLTGFVVSKRLPSEVYFFDKPVKTINEVVPENPVVIVAVTINNMVGTMKMLRNAGIKNLVQGYQFWIKKSE